MDLQNDIKSSIKNLYINDKKKKKKRKQTNMQSLSRKLEMNMHNYKEKITS